MNPTASVCGYYFMNPVAKYFNIGHIHDDQLSDYALRKGIDKIQLSKWLAINLTD
jgi:5-methyltetrahydrofolate--homocysteine methyltransferase